MITILRQLTLATVLFMASAVNAEALVVIVNKSNPLKQMSKNEVKQIFLGKTTRFENGEKVKAADYRKGDQLRSPFFKKVCNKSPKDVDNYWYRMVFTGKGVPPKSFDSEASLVDFVANNENAIGYVRQSAVSSAVKTVLVVK